MQLVFIVVENDIGHYLDLFLTAKRNRQETTRDWYAKVVRYYCEATAELGSPWPPTLTHLDLFFAALDDRGLSQSTKNNYYRALSGFFNWCEKRGHLAENPIKYIDKPEAPKHLPRGVVKSDIRTLCDLLLTEAPKAWNNLRDLVIFSLAFDTGVRIGELAKLTVDDVDLLYSQVYVYSTKDYEDRNLMLGDAAAANLASWFVARLDLVGQKERSLFLAWHNKRTIGPMSHWGMRARISKWQERAGIRHFNFHRLRHTYAIESLRNGADLLDVRDQLGHASVKTTAIYTQVIGEGRSERHQKTSPLNNLSLDRDKKIC